MHTISNVLNRALGVRWFNEFSENPTLGSALANKETGSRAPTTANPMFDNTAVLERVEKMGRALLFDSVFELDGEETRKYLRFTNGIFDLEKNGNAQSSTGHAHLEHNGLGVRGFRPARGSGRTAQGHIV